jgi:hypothetical protein
VKTKATAFDPEHFPPAFPLSARRRIQQPGVHGISCITVFEHRLAPQLVGGGLLGGEGGVLSWEEARVAVRRDAEEDDVLGDLLSSRPD